MRVTIANGTGVTMVVGDLFGGIPPWESRTYSVTADQLENYRALLKAVSASGKLTVSVYPDETYPDQFEVPALSYTATTSPDPDDNDIFPTITGRLALFTGEGTNQIGPSSVIEEDNVIVFEKDIQLPPASIYLGESVKLSNFGQNLAVSDLAADKTSVAPYSDITRDFGSLPLTEFVISPATQNPFTPGGDVFTGSMVEYVFGPFGSGEFLNWAVVLDFAATQVLPWFRVRVWQGSDAMGIGLVNETFRNLSVGPNTEVEFAAPYTLNTTLPVFVRYDASDPFSLNGMQSTQFLPRVSGISSSVTRRTVASGSFVWKPSARVATTGNITLSGLQTIDGVSVIAGNRVLVRAQTDATQNGIYVVAAGAWARSADSNTSEELQPGVVVPVDEGTTQQGQIYVQTTPDPVLGTTPIVMVSLAAIPPTRTLFAGNGLTGGGNLMADRTFRVVAADATISVTGDGVAVGVLTSANHGNLNGGSLHTLATTGTAGFMSAAMVSKLDGIVDGATNTPLSNDDPEPVAALAADPGVSTEAARSDHSHEATTATAITVGTVNAEGTASSLARSDHTHAVSGLAIAGQTQGDFLYYNGTSWVRFAAGTQDQVLRTNGSLVPAWSTVTSGTTPEAVDADTGTVGSASTLARSDHSHEVLTATAVSVGTSNSEGTASTLARSDHTHEVTGLTIPGSVAGDLIYYNGSEWVGIPVGGDNQALIVMSGVPGWHGFLASTDPVNVTKSAASVGVSTTAARSDHKHDVTTAVAVTTGTVNAEGVATTLARSDHTHVVSGFVISGQASGDLLYFNGTSWVRVPVGLAGQVLSVVSSLPTWTTLASDTAPVNVTKATASAGTSPTLSRSDHKHDVATAVAVSTSTANSEGVATTLARSDHTHEVLNFTISGQIQGDVLYFNGSSWIRLAIGLSGTVLSSTGTVPSWVNPLTASAPVDVSKSAAVTGVATTAARSDHKHDVTTAAAVTVGTANAEGSASTLARSDHTHVVSGLSISGQTNGDLLYFNGTSWVRLPVGATNQVLEIIAGIPAWTTFLATGAPVDVSKSAASSGSATTSARSDHKHDVITGVPVAIGAANAEGTATTLARSDHVHDGRAFSSEMVFGASAIAVTTTARFLYPGFGVATAATTSVAVSASRNGTLRNMRIRQNAPGSGAGTITYTLVVNGIATALAVSTTTTDTTGSNLVNTVAITAGDSIVIQVTKSMSIATPPADITCVLEWI